MTALYRKYRPQDFDEVVGQDAVVRTLKNAIGSGQVRQAYLFAGPRGTGKSHIYKEISPNSILISGGQTTVANLFYNMATGKSVILRPPWDIKPDTHEVEPFEDSLHPVTLRETTGVDHSALVTSGGARSPRPRAGARRPPRTGRSARAIRRGWAACRSGCAAR